MSTNKEETKEKEEEEEDTHDRHVAVIHSLTIITQTQTHTAISYVRQPLTCFAMSKGSHPALTVCTTLRFSTRGLRIVLLAEYLYV